MITAMVSGVGLISSSASAKASAWPCSMNCDTNGGITIAASTALLLSASAIWVNGKIFTSTSAIESPTVSSILPVS